MGEMHWLPVLPQEMTKSYIFDHFRSPITMLMTAARTVIITTAARAAVMPELLVKHPPQHPRISLMSDLDLFLFNINSLLPFSPPWPDDCRSIPPAPILMGQGSQVEPNRRLVSCTSTLCAQSRLYPAARQPCGLRHSGVAGTNSDQTRSV